MTALGLNKKVLAALVVVLFLQGLFLITLMSAMQAPMPHNMPIGVTGPSQVVDDVAAEASLNVITYANEAEVTAAAEQGELYGAYLTGTISDTLIVVPANSFFGEIYVRDFFMKAAKENNRPLTVNTIAPLPAADRLGTVSGLLMLPTLLGGYLVASFLFKVTSTATQARRITILIGFSIIAALLIDILAGPLLGAYSMSYFWILWPCFALVLAAVALSAAAIQGFAGAQGTLIVALLFVIVGGPPAGGIGVYLLPTYWQTIGAFFPARHAVELYRHILYFNGSHILVPIVVLSLYALAGLAGILFLERRRPPTAASAAKPVKGQIVFALAWATLMTGLFALNYISAGHSPLALNMPFGVVGSSELVTAVQEQMSLDVITYANESDAQAAMDRTEIYGALYVGDTSSTLMVMPSLSDIAPLDLVLQFETASENVGQPITIQQYVPVPLAPGDPFALVASLLLVPLLVGGYMSASTLVNASGRASMRGRGLVLIGVAVVAGLLMDIIGVVLFKGLPMESFWILWPIMSLIILVVALVATVLRRLLGPVGVFVTVIAVVQFGNPSSGGANGVAYLPQFWNTIGHFLPARSGLLLMRNVAYFEGNSITQPLGILFAYLVVFGGILFLLDWFKSPEPPVDHAEQAVAMMPVPPGAI